MPTETFAPESYPEPGIRATRTINSRLRDAFRPSEYSGKKLLVICAVIFFVAFGVRFLSWQDNRRDVWRVETFVTAGYKESAHKLLHGELPAFVSDLDDMAHPPGYSILLAGIFKVELEVRANNDGARLFYERMGYRGLTHLPGYYQGTEAALRMSRDLSCNSGSSLRET